MVKVLLNNGTELQATSINGMCQEIAKSLNVKAPSGMNRTSAVKWMKRNEVKQLEINGEIIDLDNIETTTRTTERNPHALIERLIKATTTIDADKIKELETELQQKLLTAKSIEDLQDIKAIQEKINELKNPSPNLLNIIDYIKKLYQDYNNDQQATEQPNE